MYGWIERLRWVESTAAIEKAGQAQESKGVDVADRAS